MLLFAGCEGLRNRHGCQADERGRDSHVTKIATRFVGLFYRSRLDYITETASIAKCLKLAKAEDKASIKKRLEEALEQLKDDAEADPVRESEERTKTELAAMQTKIDKLTDMLEKLSATHGTSATGGSSTGSLDNQQS